MSTVPSSLSPDELKLAIVEIYKENYSLYYNVAWHYVQNRSAAEDIVQNAFSMILDAFENVVGLTRPELEKYLMVIVKHEALRAKKGACVEFPLEHLEDKPSEEPDGPCEHVIKNFEQELVRKSVERLSERYRFCLELKYLYNLPIEKMCELTHTTPTTFNPLLQRAKAKLLEVYLHLEKWGE